MIRKNTVPRIMYTLCGYVSTSTSIYWVMMDVDVGDDGDDLVDVYLL